jgi:polysaccharide export outer membrane protein
MKARLTVFAVAALLWGCRGGLPASAPGAPAADEQGSAAEAKEAAAVAAAMRQASRTRVDYRISAADLVSVTVYDAPEMSRKARVNASGVIFLPLIGAVEVGGKTPGAAQALIEKKLSPYVVRPQVSLFIEEYGNKNYFVMGEVTKPGSYPIPTESRITVLEAISTAGGFTPVAAPDRTRVLRYVNGKSVHYTIDVRTITRGGQKDKDLALEPNDVIFVPQSLF